MRHIMSVIAQLQAPPQLGSFDGQNRGTFFSWINIFGMIPLESRSVSFDRGFSRTIGEKSMTHLTIAIDGPASSGKSTVARRLAKDLSITYIDTGAMYRALTWAILDAGIELEDHQAIQQLLADTQLDLRYDSDGVQEIYLNQKNISQVIRTPQVTQAVSLISSYDYVRRFLVRQQQLLANERSVVMDGRDIGTVVLPDANFKFFLDASVEVRAQRRYLENVERGFSDQSLEQIAADIERRDQYDRTREHSPLVQAADAILVDTSHLTIDEVVDRLKSIIKF